MSAAGPSPDDERFHFLWPKLGELKADIVDQHCYANPIWFLSNSDRFDKYDRNGPKVFFGEYAAQSVAIVSTKNRNNLECALSEAAYMTGMERNADVVRMASYAPLFANVDAWQWTPNLIWVDSLHVVATPNYYVQQLFTHNRGDVVLPVSNTATVHELLPAGRIGVGTTKASAEFKDLHVTHGDRTLLTAEFTDGTGDWSGGPTWHAADGTYRQTDAKATITSLVGDKNWTDYTLTLKARKLAGEGSLIFTVCDDGAGSRAQWILGGWGNQQHGIQTHFAEQDQLLDRVPGSIEDNRWYDIKIAIHRCEDGVLSRRQARSKRRRAPPSRADAVYLGLAGRQYRRNDSQGGEPWKRYRRRNDYVVRCRPGSTIGTDHYTDGKWQR